MIQRRGCEDGNAIVEFALVLSVLLGIITAGMDIARGMWVYETLSMSVKQASRYLSVHGAECASASASCPVTLGQTMQLLSRSAIGLDLTQLQLTLTAGSQTVSCASASACLTNSTTWPPQSSNAVGTMIQISASYQFNPLVSAWCGQGCSSMPLRANTAETVQF
jgi:Flp pilus assembly protein TadG